jgi:hypothetical protein
MHPALGPSMASARQPDPRGADCCVARCVRGPAARDAGRRATTLHPPRQGTDAGDATADGERRRTVMKRMCGLVGAWTPRYPRSCSVRPSLRGSGRPAADHARSCAPHRVTSLELPPDRRTAGSRSLTPHGESASSRLTAGRRAAGRHWSRRVSRPGGSGRGGALGARLSWRRTRCLFTFDLGGDVLIGLVGAFGGVRLEHAVVGVGVWRVDD